MLLAFWVCKNYHQYFLKLKLTLQLTHFLKTKYLDFEASTVQMPTGSLWCHIWKYQLGFWAATLKTFFDRIKYQTFSQLWQALMLVVMTALQQDHKAVWSKCERWNDECVNTLSSRKIYGGDLWIIPRQVSRLMWLARITLPSDWAGQKYCLTRLVSCGFNTHNGTLIKFKLKLAMTRLGARQPKTQHMQLCDG